MVRAALSKLPGVDFTEAASGLEAIERLAIGTVALVVLDLNMPDMHGLEVLEFVRSHQKYRELPIIVLTTRGDETTRTLALNAGATAYLTKPFAPQQLVDQAQPLLGAKAPAR
jgi:two-component system chemotaxis response regulator CheY